MPLYRVNEGWEPSVFRAMFADWLTPTGDVCSRMLTNAAGDLSKRNVERETTKLCSRMLTYAYAYVY